MATDWVALSYALTVTSLVSIALYAVIYTKLRLKSSSETSHLLQTSEGFLTAKKSQGMYRIAWSFYAGSVGSWCITSPSNYATYAGWIGMIFMAIGTGVPLIVQSYFGSMVQSKYPTVNSFGDFITARFGPTAKLACIGVALINMAVMMLAEFTTIGGLFRDFVGTEGFPIILIVATVTTVYTMYGGLLVSIVTDQVQGITSVVLITTISIYVAATFKRELPPNFGSLKQSLGPNQSGYSSILVMPASLMSSVMFNEGMWQRVWAAKDPQSLKRGGVLACLAVVSVVFLFGLGGFLAAWGGLIDFQTGNPNLYLFQVFKSSPNQNNVHVNQFIEVLVLVLAAVMNESAIDSVQNGLAATISTQFLRGKPLIWARGCVLVITVIIVPFALANYAVLSIFLLPSILAVCWLFPVMLGGIWDTPLGLRVVSESSLIFGGLAAVLSVSAYGI
ncbi:hypothetical protein GUITHDRAFT_75395, partial [Guillardia theta CCMP2712]